MIRIELARSNGIEVQRQYGRQTRGSYSYRYAQDCISSSLWVVRVSYRFLAGTQKQLLKTENYFARNIDSLCIVRLIHDKCQWQVYTIIYMCNYSPFCIHINIPVGMIPTMITLYSLHPICSQNVVILTTVSVLLSFHTHMFIRLCTVIYKLFIQG